MKKKVKAKVSKKSKTPDCATCEREECINCFDKKKPKKKR